MSSNHTFERALCGPLMVLVIYGASLLNDGCARRPSGARPPEIGEQGKPQAGAVAKDDGQEVSGSGSDGGAGSIHLPGENRVLPSQDPRNLEGTRVIGSAERASGTKTVAAASPQELPKPPAAADNPSGPARDALAPGGGIPVPPPIPEGESRFRVQVLASGIPPNAYRVRGELQESIGIPVYVEQEQGILKVRAGDFVDRIEAETLRRRLFGLGYGDAFVVECRGR